METIIITTEADIEKIIERVIERKFPKPSISEVEMTYSINQVAKMLKLYVFKLKFTSRT